MSISQHNQGRLEKTLEFYFKIPRCTSFQARRTRTPSQWRTRCLCPVHSYLFNILCLQSLSRLQGFGNLKPLQIQSPEFLWSPHTASHPSQVLVFVSIQWDPFKKLSWPQTIAMKKSTRAAPEGTSPQRKACPGKKENKAGSQQSQFEVTFKSWATTT